MGSHLAAPTTLQSILLAAHPVQRWPGSPAVRCAWLALPLIKIRQPCLGFVAV